MAIYFLFQLKFICTLCKDNLRALLNKERSLAKALGEETLGVEVRSRIPSTATVRRIEEKVEELGPIF